MFPYTCIYKIVYCLATALKIILISAVLKVNISDTLVFAFILRLFCYCFENHFDLWSFKVNISDALVFAFILRLSVCLLVIQPIDLL